MALNFPDSPVNGEIYFDENSQFYYSWNEQYQTWTSYSPSSARGIKVIDDISSQFNGVETVFPLTAAGATISPTTTKQLLVSLDGLDQVPAVDYTVAGTILIFTVAPANGVEFSAINIGSSFPVLNSELRCVNNSHDSLDHFPIFVDPDGAIGNPSEARVSTTKLKFNPTTGELFSTKLSGSGEGITNVSISGIDLSGDSTFINIIATDVSVSNNITKKSYTVPSITVNTTASINPVEGDLWVDNNTNPVKFKIYDGTSWIEIGTFSSINVGDSLSPGDITVNGDITATGITGNIIGAKVQSIGVVEDFHGPLRRLPIGNHSDDYTLVSTDAGKLIRQDTSSKTITIPADILSPGDMVTIFNVSDGNITIDKSTVTLYNTVDGTDANRTLAAKGVCTIACTAANEFIISGSGLS